MITMYSCDVCSNMIEMISDSGVIPVCCGQEMQPLKMHDKDQGTEKHLPCVVKHQKLSECQMKDITDKVCLLRVRVGAQDHPMTDKHMIEWIIVETDKAVYRKCIKQSEEPQADFYIDCCETIENIYAYCNMHGMWRISCTK